VTKLHQILAVENGIRTQVQTDLTAAHHGLQKADLIIGIYRDYQPVKEDGEKLPPERQLLQTRVPEVIKASVEIWEKTFNITATRDFTNTAAKADVVLEDGTPLMKAVPTTYLLWLEKKLEDLHTFVVKLPTLPADTEWVWDPTQMCYKNKMEIKTVKTAKIAYPLVLTEATKEHPAQVIEKARDEIVGHWTTIKYSGAITVKDAKAMKGRVEALQKAVKFAREKANETEVTDQKVGGPLLKYVFGDMA